MVGAAKFREVKERLEKLLAEREQLAGEDATHQMISELSTKNDKATELISSQGQQISELNNLVKTLEEKLQFLISHHNKLLSHHMDICSRADLYDIPSRSKDSKYSCFMFAFAAVPIIRKDIMTDVIQRMDVGKFEENVMYCVMHLFKERREQCFMSVISKYNSIAGPQSSIRPVIINESSGRLFPAIIASKRWQKNPIKAKRDIDESTQDEGYQSWTNPPTAS